MPWCEPCSRFLNPNSLSEDGQCPHCGRVLEAAPQVAERQAAAEDAARVPWHFWLLLAAIVLYLGWRVIQGIDALAGWLA